MSIDLYYWPTPNGHKITIALEEMGLPYTVHPVNIGAGEQFQPDFLKISPNNRMPALVDSDGPGGQPISIFESGAILQYLARKTGLFGGKDARDQAEVESWLMWQMGGFGPMAGQANHFRHYAPAIEPDDEKLVYGRNRYTNEMNRLFGVLDKRLADRDFVAGDLSIADFAIWPWAISAERFGQDIADFPNVAAWIDRCGTRAGFANGKAVGEDLRKPLEADTEEAKKARAMLFGQKART
ncbi:glutathione S-transferase family protein [Sphingobium boeckii]|uniref:Glutathione S-transferase n=1 Tax=Sphingobium boeckii TaxID=1082345 RepID=A0A7W9AFF8_9SPHN|nr:glutathione S-transferase N-terminal domain-containing protein [Sphingobium boeckii]MBB5684630.1 glutathione S-transferase [Sphingobium boeckii]